MALCSKWMCVMTIKIEHDFECDPKVLWNIVGQPDRVDWVPGVESCEFDGRVRAMEMAGAGLVKEEIFALDSDTMTIRYGVVESTPPLESHQASIQVEPRGDGARLTWRTEVAPEPVEKFIRRSMEGCLAQLETLVASDS